jgi:hypothetical protein
MTDTERAILRRVHGLQAELFTLQGKEMEAVAAAVDELARAMKAMRQAHDVLGQLLAATAELAALS